MAWGAAIGAVVGVFGAIEQADATAQAHKYASIAADIRLKQQDTANAISRRDAIRSYRMQSAQAQAAGSSEGTVTSSVVAGAQGSLGSQIQSNVSHFDTNTNLDAQYNAANKKAGQYMNTAGTWGSVSQQGQGIGMALNSIWNLSTTSTSKV